jgi:hypothetical protein
METVSRTVAGSTTSGAPQNSGSRKEGKQAVRMTLLSCHRFRSNEVRLWLRLIAQCH